MAQTCAEDNTLGMCCVTKTAYKKKPFMYFTVTISCRIGRVSDGYGNYLQQKYSNIHEHNY